MYFLELVKHEGKSLGWSVQNKRGFEPIIRHAKSNFDSLSPLRQLCTLKSWRQNNVTWGETSRALARSRCALARALTIALRASKQGARPRFALLELDLWASLGFVTQSFLPHRRWSERWIPFPLFENISWRARAKNKNSHIFPYIWPNFTILALKSSENYSLFKELTISYAP